MTKAPAGHRTCNICRVTKLRDHFGTKPNGNPRDYCKDCRVPRLGAHPVAPWGMARCKRCTVVKPHDQFTKTPKGRPFPYCKACGTPKHRQRVKGSLTVAPHKCAVCNGPIAKDLPLKRVAQLKTCSTRCRIAYAQKDHTCSRCKKTQPCENFERRRLGRGRLNICRSCKERDTNLFDGHLFLRRPYSGFRADLLRMANNRRLPVHMSEEHMCALYESGCQLCGRLVSIALVNKGARAVSHFTVSVYCARCGRVAKAIGAVELICMASEIYSYAPLTRRSDDESEDD